MSKLIIKRRPSKSPQIGDLRYKIKIQERNITPPIFGTASHTQIYSTIATVWSNIITNKGIESFNNVSPENSFTHLFTIRYRDDVTTENIINYSGDNYKIKIIDNPELRDRFLFLFCNLLGNDTLAANR